MTQPDQNPRRKPQRRIRPLAHQRGINVQTKQQGHVYGDFDQDVQYAMFSELALRFLKEINLQADILHCNDWQTGPVPYFLNVRYNYDPFYWDMRTVYSIHNLM